MAATFTFLPVQQVTRLKSRRPEYHAWRDAVQRCTNPASKSFRWYGARGITVCLAWRESFEDFMSDMGRRPGPDYSLDRIDNNGNYEPGNCRWATREQQNSNRRPPSRPANNPDAIGATQLKSGRWQAQITVRNKNIYLGTFATRDAAHREYRMAKNEFATGSIT